MCSKQCKTCVRTWPPHGCLFANLLPGFSNPENGTTIHLLAQNKNVEIAMNSSIPLLPDVQSIVIHLNSFSVWFLLTVSTASTLSSNSPHPCADYCTHLLNSLSAFNLSHNPLFGFLDPNHPELLLGRWWVHLMEWWTYSAKRWGERKGRVCIWGRSGCWEARKLKRKKALL